MKRIALITIWLFAGLAFAQKSRPASDYKDLILTQKTGLKPFDLEGLTVGSVTHDSKKGIDHVYLRQHYMGIPVFNAVLGLHLSINGKVLAVNHTFQPNLEELKLNPVPSTGMEDAIMAAMALHVTDAGPLVTNKELRKVSVDGNTGIYRYPEKAIGDIRIHLTWVKTGGTLKLAWNVNWQPLDAQNWWNTRMDAHSNILIDENNWVAHCFGNPHTHKINEEHIAAFPSPGNGEGMGEGSTNVTYKVLPRPVESPNHGSMVLLKDPSDSIASPFAWHDVNGVPGHEYTITRGNNVFAYEDKDANNTPGYSPSGGSSLTFDYTFDKSKRHSDYLDAAITNLFYWNNLMHDVWYQYGFDSESGNFEQSDYGRGGIDGDAVQAEAQDGSGTNNANFATPPDGMTPRMQMYVWNVSAAGQLMRIQSPSSLARSYTSVQAGFGPKLTKTPITGNIVLVNDGSATPTLGCTTLTNGAQLSGQIALIDRGNCTFLEKVQLAQSQGAKAVIVINNVSGNPITMGGTGGSGITIPSIMITKADGDAIKAVLANNITVKGSLFDSLSTAGKQFDSDFDNGIISHEYGHGISNRLTGGPDNTDCLNNEEQMGEGWSDFFSLVMTHKPGDTGPDKRGIGTYAIDEPVSGDGIRNYPYSTSMSINPVTYNNIKSFSVPHGVGSVWCSMLWDLYWDLIGKYGYDPDIYHGKGGNNIAMQLVIDGMKLQPCNPGFADGRDAILLADRLNNKGANQEIIWKAFARRGLGYSAKQGSTGSRSDGTESFDVPKFDLPEIEKSSPALVDNQDTLTYTIRLKNTTINQLRNLMVTDTLPSDVQFIKASGIAGGTFSDGIFKVEVPTLNAGDSLLIRIHTRMVSGGITELTETSDFESSALNSWKDSTLSGSVLNGISTKKKNNGVSSFYLQNPATATDKVLMRYFTLTTPNPHLVFYHYYNTEDGWDGAVVEILRNGAWTDLGSRMVENGYNSVIAVNPASKISGRAAFTGNSGRFVRTSIDLTDFTGKTVRIRFRFTSDAAQGGDGWYLDDISLAPTFHLVSNSAYVTNGGSKGVSTTTSMVTKAREVAVKTIRPSSFRIAPNPFNAQIRIETGLEKYSWTLTDVAGHLVMEQAGNSGSVVISTEELVAGTYFLRLNSARGTEVFQLVK